MLHRLIRLLAVGLLAGLAPAQATPPTALSAELDALVRTAIDRGAAGTLLVAENNRITWIAEHGLAVRTSERPFTAATVTSLGSITKLFTAAAILKLETAGALERSDPLRKWFDDVPDDKADITLEQLLIHTSGLPDDEESLPPGVGGDDVAATRAQMLDAVWGIELATPPGERFAYCNLGYSVLAAVIELAAEQPYEQYVRQRIFEPAGMLETGYRSPTWHRDRLAHGYHRDRDWGTVVDRGWIDDGPGWFLRGNGGMHSTALDLYRWTQAMTGDAVFSDEERVEFLRPRGDSGFGPFTYGGVSVTNAEGQGTIFFGGGNGFFSAAMFVQPAAGNTVLFVTNNESASQDLLPGFMGILGVR